MALKKISKIAALAMAAVMVSEAGLTSFVPLTAEAKEKEETIVEEVMNASSSSDNFTWDNATVYFVLTDRFENGNKENDHSYGRSVGEVDADNYENRIGTFHGGDLAGMTKKINEGYFDDLGVNAIWISAPYEQIHGAICAQYSDNDGFKHYAYHGYYPLDWSSMDANMGTEAEMKEFVDTAHEHGIRVVLDVVMNHVGYADPVTATTYGFGGVASDWKNLYYNTSEKSYRWYHDYSTETTDGKYTLNSNADWTSKWWGPSWVRAIDKRFSGYSGSESDSVGDLKICTGGLPDIKTEDGNDNGLPPVLATKWKDEGRYEQEMAELDTFFSENNLQRRNVNYVVKWLTDFVKDYGVDGFRCDTAKHIEVEHWKTLRDCASKALKEWRKNNPDNVAASWDEDFWMTGEVFGFTGGKNEYFTSGAFDSLINFSLHGKNSDNSHKYGADMEQLYSSYASSINSDSDYNMLTYISSHDVGLGSRDPKVAASLLLCPGGVQIYYGDETGRTTGNLGANVEQGWRSQMNWSGATESNQLYVNYQKIGQFRKNHVSVGAGAHKRLDGNDYTFSRIYHLGQEDEDKVVVSLPFTAGTHSVNVSGVFADNETVVDAYSGESYTVSGGKVSVTSDSNGIILLEKTGAIKPSVGANITSGTYQGTTYSSETIQVKLSANKVKDATYSVNGGEEKAFNADDVITLGGGTAYEEKTTLVLKGKSEEDNSDVEKIVTYQKCKEPTISGTTGIKVAKSEFTEAPFCYAYSATTELNGKWPGNKMVDDGQYWSFTPEGTESFAMILSDSSGWRSTADGEDGLSVTGTQLYTKSTGKLTELQVGDKAKVTVKYVDEAGNDLTGGLNVYRVGAEGDSYTTSARNIPGCTLKETPSNATGTFTKDEITVTYVYSGGEQPTNTPIPTETGIPTPTMPIDVTSTPIPTGIDNPTNTPVPTTGEITDTPHITEVPTNFALDGFTVVKTRDGIKLIANTSGGNGAIRYMFSYEKDGKEILIANFQSESEYIWKAPAAGTYTLNVYAINCGTILDKTVEDYTVR